MTDLMNRGTLKVGSTALLVEPDKLFDPAVNYTVVEVVEVNDVLKTCAIRYTDGDVVTARQCALFDATWCRTNSPHN